MGELISEAASKKKRGRPPLLPDNLYAFLRSNEPDIKTRRGIQDVHYRYGALNALVEDPAFAWLCDKEKMLAGKKNAWKPAILTELGRLNDVDLIKAYAAQICEMKPSAKKAIALLRRTRLGRSAPASRDLLVYAIAGAIDKYHAGRKASKADVLSALNDVYCLVEDMEWGD